MTGQEIKEIKNIISMLTEKPEECGFEVYIITKSEPQLKKMGFIEKGTDNFYQKLKESIIKSLSEKYNDEEAEYVSADYIADDQRKFYIIPISQSYNPLPMLNTKAGTFSKNDIGDATGIAFSLRRDKNQIWVYQHLWSIMVPNKSKKNLMARLVSGERDVFEEMTDPIITFTEKCDFLVIDNNIITSDYKLLQNSFGFQDYIRLRADKTIEAIESKGIVAKVDKLKAYVNRGNGKPKYAKKMMRISDSKVLEMEPTKLRENIHRSTRWNGKIEEDKNGKFVIDTYPQVEILIDLLDERYTRSDITDTEYDTDVKRVAEPVVTGTDNKGKK